MVCTHSVRVAYRETRCLVPRAQRRRAPSGRAQPSTVAEYVNPPAFSSSGARGSLFALLERRSWSDFTRLSTPESPCRFTAANQVSEAGCARHSVELRGPWRSQEKACRICYVWSLVVTLSAVEYECGSVRAKYTEWCNNTGLEETEAKDVRSALARAIRRQQQNARAFAALPATSAPMQVKTMNSACCLAVQDGNISGIYHASILYASDRCGRNHAYCSSQQCARVSVQ